MPGKQDLLKKQRAKVRLYACAVQLQFSAFVVLGCIARGDVVYVMCACGVSVRCVCVSLCVWGYFQDMTVDANLLQTFRTHCVPTRALS